MLAVIGIIAYGASSSLDFLTSEKFIINGKKINSPVINYNGNIYVPLRFIGEEMHSAVQYDENKRLTIIDQLSVKYDERIFAPVPYVAYERKYKNGNVWMQEIPLLQGNSCWTGCIEVPGPISQWIDQAEYPPVSMKAGSNLVIKYPEGMEPDKLRVFTVINTSGLKEQYTEIFSNDHGLQLPKQPGLYNFLINSEWNEGYTSYAFVVNVHN